MSSKFSVVSLFFIVERVKSENVCALTIVQRHNIEVHTCRQWFSSHFFTSARLVTRLIIRDHHYISSFTSAVADDNPP